MMQIQDGQAERRRQARNTGASQLANQHIGERIRLRRTLLGLSQSALGKALGLSFQQLQKYERGTSSIGAGQLCEVARALDVPVSFFYDGLDGVSIPTNADAGERQERFARDELEVLGHYRAAPGFIRDAIRSLLGHLSHQNPGQDRDLAGRAATKQKDSAAGSPPADDAGKPPTHDGAGPDLAVDQSPGAGSEAEHGQDGAAGMPESASPDHDRAHSKPLEQPHPAKRRRGRPRKSADTAQAELVRDRPGASAAFAAEASSPKLPSRRGIVGEPGDAVPPEERFPAEPDLPQPGSSGATKRMSGARSASRPGRAKSGIPADENAAGERTFSRADKSPVSTKAEPNRKSPRRTYGATWSPSDIGK
jgi:transcriptional regulator with XRE-family HTH domain